MTMARWYGGPWCRGAQRQHFFFQERKHALAREDRRRRLEQERLVGRAAAFGDEQKLVRRVGVGMIRIVALGIKLDLRRHIRARILLLEHGNRRQLRIAQIALEIRIARPLGQRRLIVAVGPDQPALLSHDDRGAGILTHRQHAAGGDVGVLEEVFAVGDEFVVIGSLGVFDDVLERREMRGAQQVIDVGEGGLGQRAECFARDDQHVFAHDALDLHAVSDFAVGRRVLSKGEERGVLVGGRWVGGEGGVHRGSDGYKYSIQPRRVLGTSWPTT